jgi:Leucine-rich repeat (LRR) protein
LISLTHLNLSNNQLSGSIPPAFSGITSVDVSSNPNLDRNILIAFYNFARGDDWSTRYGWAGGTDANGNTFFGTEGTECDWYGITCTSGEITTLRLPDNNLSGSIAAALGNLASLELIVLSQNNFSGTIPSELGNLTNLQELYLWENSLQGSIPAELGNLTNLTKLGLSLNQLTGSIPTELGNLTSLTRLNLHDNQLTGSIPTELGNLTSLSELFLYDNSLTGSIPKLSSVRLVKFPSSAGIEPVSELS